MYGIGQAFFNFYVYKNRLFVILFDKRRNFILRIHNVNVTQHENNKNGYDDEKIEKEKAIVKGKSISMF